MRMSAANSRSTVEQAPSAKEHGRKRPGARQSRPQELRSTEEQKPSARQSRPRERRSTAEERCNKGLFVFSFGCNVAPCKAGIPVFKLGVWKQTPGQRVFKHHRWRGIFCKGFYAIARRKKQTFHRNVCFSCGPMSPMSPMKPYEPYGAL